MPLLALLPELLGGLAFVMGSLVGRVLLALGMSYVTYSGIDAINSNIVSTVQSNLSGVGADVVGMLSYLWLDKAVSMVLSSYAAAVAMKVTAGSITKMVIKK
ncbi:DUF2523 domain-containing protein [Collimonas antrihumi]|uniref:DUF2523 domain-containing protein n=1 Tax=Collimonas antrihumi TaxID=1940615 RepID=UPI001B8ABCEC|nr:DUF2523 domain-containing protein [Collimonas antrihumi]